MTLARKVVAGRTYLISRRCTQRQFLLRPEPLVEQIYLYCLGEAAQRYEITLHGYIAMSNHQHLVARDNRGNFPEFLAHLHKMIAKAMNRHRDRWENFWATEQPNAVYLVEPCDRFAKLVYLLANPVNGHLVDRISDWPGAISLGLHLWGGFKTVKRPLGYFRADGNMPDEVTIRIERPDGFENLSEAEWVAMLRSAMRREEERAREVRRAAGHGVLTRRRILTTDPKESPTTVDRRRTLRPNVACLNEERRIYELDVLTAFRVERYAALVRALKGESDVIFPFGTYRIRGFFVAAPPPLAVSLSHVGAHRSLPDVTHLPLAASPGGTS